MSAVVQSGYMTPSAFLLAENGRADGEKFEYVNGQIYAMAGASRGHNRVSFEFARLLSNHLTGSRCEVFHTDMKVGIQTLDDVRFYYPDVQVTCEEEPENHFNTSPCLIVEVLSESTERTDRTEKLAGYRLIPALQEYVLCSQDSPYIEVYRRSNGWEVAYYHAGDMVVLSSVGLELGVNTIYAFFA